MALRNINCKNQQIKLQITGFSTSFYKYDTFNICFTSSARGKSWELSWIVWFYPHPLSLSQSVLVSTNNVKWDCLTESCSSSWSCHHGCFSQLQTFSKISTACLSLHHLSKLVVWALLPYPPSWIRLLVIHSLVCIMFPSLKKGSFYQPYE